MTWESWVIKLGLPLPISPKVSAMAIAAKKFVIV